MALEFRVADTISAVDPQAWDACAAGHPFVRHAFLQALETSGALGRDTGVVTRYALLTDTTQGLVACAPAMFKRGTLREFGPELRWLKAGLAAGCFAWPKFQVGLPFFPVMGPKLLVRKDLPGDPLRRALIQGLQRVGQRADGQSVFNVMHIDAATARLCKEQGALLAGEWHSMWTNVGYTDLSDYLARLPERKHYQYRKERRRAESHGLEFRVLRGRELTDEVMADYYEGHRRVCERYSGRPWLPASTYAAIAAGLPQDVLLMGYFDGRQFVAGIMSLDSQAEQALYLLQWSEMHKLPDLAMDLICRRPIDYGYQSRCLFVFRSVNIDLAHISLLRRSHNASTTYFFSCFYGVFLKREFFFCASNCFY